MGEPGSDLLFDRAQYEAPAEAACTFCKRPLGSSYFQINGRLACEPCRMGVETALRSGSGVARLARAALFGAGAAALGGALYYGIREVSGYELSLISIFVGWLVGLGVRVGARARGGVGYQLLAAFLTYTAIVGTYAPFLLHGMSQRANAAAEKKKAQSPSEPLANDAARAQSRPGRLLTGLAFLTAFVYALPFWVVFASGGKEGLIGLVIIGFGVWQAWKMNGKVRLQIEGPFALSSLRPPTPPGAA
jgi:hypothetical protein